VAQERLFRLAVEAGSVTFWHEPAIGWHLVINLRRGDEAWWETTKERYQGMSTSELLDTLYAHLDGVL
jgi:hypothetical protein